MRGRCGLMADGTAGILHRPAVPGLFRSLFARKGRIEEVIIILRSIHEGTTCPAASACPLAPAVWWARYTELRKGWGCPALTDRVSPLNGGRIRLIRQAGQAYTMWRSACVGSRWARLSSALWLSGRIAARVR